MQRTRPVVFFAGRVTMQPYELGGYRIPRGVMIGAARRLTHFDPRLFAQPAPLQARALRRQARPDTYSWIPFGGGVRRCIGATFAHMEMDVVLRTLLERVTLEPTTRPDERWKFRGIVSTPSDGGEIVVV